jgi:hypothetical protein
MFLALINLRKPNQYRNQISVPAAVSSRIRFQIAATLLRIRIGLVERLSLTL